MKTANSRTAAATPEWIRTTGQEHLPGHPGPAGALRA